MNELDKTIDDCLKKAKEYDELAISYREIQDDYVRILGTEYKPDYSTSKECTMSASKNRQLAEWLKELKAYRELIANADKLIESRYGVVIIEGYSDVFAEMKEIYEEANADDN